jgi:uncharacterized protein (TIGR02266 family)
MGFNKRQAPRVQHELLVAYRTVGGFVSEWAVNLSRGGLFINTRNPLPVGSEVKLMVALPGEAFPYELAGRVVRVESVDNAANVAPGMGIEFVGVDGKVIDELSTFVDRLRSSL